MDLGREADIGHCLARLKPMNQVGGKADTCGGLSTDTALYLVSVSAMTHPRHKESRVSCPAILVSIYRGEDSCMLQVSDAAGRRLC